MSESAFALSARVLWERGYSILPARPGFKIPGKFTKLGYWQGLDGWQKYCTTQCTEDEVELWQTWPKAGLCLCLGPASNVVAIDFDTCPEVWSKLEAVIPQSPVTKRGEKGYTAFYQFNGEVSKNWRAPDGKSNIVELLSTGRQTIIPTTIHPKTQKPYEWVGDSLENITATELPTLPEDIIAKFDEILGVKTNKQKSEPSLLEEKPSLQMLAEALSFVSPDISYPDWRNMGMAIHHCYPTQDGLAVWNDWSAKGEKYKKGETEKAWRSFKADGGITAASLFDLAKVSGFSNWGFDIDIALEHVTSELAPPRPKQEQPATSSLVIPQSLLTSAPGFVGELTDWILSTALKPQPALALGAALAAVGALKGHRVRTETNLRTNLYILGLAGSGSGKNHPLNCIRMLFAAAGLSRLLGGEPGSEPGLIQAIADGQGRSVILWDEMGHAISAMTNPNAGTYLTTILSTLTKLFSEASTLHQGKVLAAGSRTSIDQPCLSVFGVTVPGRFFDTLSSEHAIDGFLARWMIFEAETNRPAINTEAVLLDVPQRLINQVCKLESLPFRPPAEPGRINQDIIQPTAVPFTASARKMFWEAQQHFDDVADQAEKRGEPTAPIFVRSAEHAAKMALTVAGTNEITQNELSWALELSQLQSYALAASVLQRIGKNSTERTAKEVLRIIRSSGPSGITGTRLYRETMWLSSNDRKSVLSTLIDSDQVGVVAEERKGKGPRAVTYLAT